MRPVTEDVLAACFAYLATVFEPGTKLGPSETELRLRGWRMTCGDIPSDLWQIATETCCATLKWMPKPVELREAVAAQLERRTMAIKRLKLMLAAPADRPFVAEPWPVRVKTMRDSFFKIGKLGKAQHYENMLAEIEQREPACL